MTRSRSTPRTFKDLGRLGSGPITLEVTSEPNRTELSLDGLATSFECDHPAHHPPETYDFALFVAAICSIETGREVVLDKPVAEGAVRSLGDLSRLLAAWRLDGLAVPKVRTPLIVPRPHTDDAASMCLSGGVDSTYAALSAAKEQNLRFAVLVHGADYRQKHAGAFAELEARVRNTATFLDLDLAVVRSDMRNLGFNWEMLHGLFFAAALNFFGGGVGRALFALDYAGWQDHLTHPWGSSRALIEVLSVRGRPLEPVGAGVTRVDKIKAIAQHPELVANLSVCFSDKSTGRNCGKCRKCMRTRLALEFIGADVGQLFVNYPDMEEFFRADRVPRTANNARGYFVMTENLHRIAPEGRMKSILSQKLDAAWHLSGFSDPKSTPFSRLVRSARDYLRALTVR